MANVATMLDAARHMDRFKNADGKPVGGRMDLHEGWFALPLDGEE